MKKIIVAIVLGYLRFWAKVALKINKPKIIGIAGSVGKSSTKYVLNALLKDYFRVQYTSGNSETGVPLGILGISPIDFSARDWLRMLFIAPFRLFYLHKVQYLIVEMGTDAPFPPKNMEYLLKIVKPDIALFLNAAAAHTEQFEKVLSSEDKKLSPEKKLPKILMEIAKEDGKIITQSNCKTGIYCCDNKYVNTVMEDYKKKKKKDQKLLTFGRNQKNNLWYDHYEIDLQKTLFELFHLGNALFFECRNFILPLEYREVIGAAVLTAFELGLTQNQMQDAFSKNFSLPNGRASLLPGIKNSIILDSSYNASRDSISAFLKSLSLLKKSTDRPVLFAFGDMNELGTEAAFEHQQVLHSLIGIVDYLYCVGPFTHKYVLRFLEKDADVAKNFKAFRWFKTSKELGDFLKIDLPKNAFILVKGSQNGIFMEEALKPLLLLPSDEKKLCRQDSFWMQQKKMFFKSC